MQLCTMFGGGTYEHLQTIYILKTISKNPHLLRLCCASQSKLQLKNSTQVTEAQEAPPPEDWVVRRRGDHVYISPSMQILVTPAPPTA